MAYHLSKMKWVRADHKSMCPEVVSGHVELLLGRYSSQSLWWWRFICCGRWCPRIHLVGRMPKAGYHFWYIELGLW